MQIPLFHVPLITLVAFLTHTFTNNLKSMVTKSQGCDFQHPSTQHITHGHTTKFHDTLVWLKVHFCILAHHPHLTSEHKQKLPYGPSYKWNKNESWQQFQLSSVPPKGGGWIIHPSHHTLQHSSMCSLGYVL
jgi:hypothetical protein